jgi:D-beta-D-heptose 7-phosphate kinase/D-beta-D-heptose 1-phosphate adenosyltransferase
MKTSVADKIVLFDRLCELTAGWRKRGETIAFTNGVFDILHRGHLNSLERAADLADRLIVAVNSDRSVRGLGKGEERPLNREQDRAALIAALAIVDAAIIFDEPTPLELIRAVRPNVLVKGGDYAVNEVVGREFADRVVLVETLPGYSTSSLIARIKCS